jgi:hypothetical protein
MASIASIIASVEGTGAPQQLLQGDPAVQVNKERAAVVLDTGFRIYDTYNSARPWIFAGGLAGTALSGFMLYKRRSKSPETVAWWMASLVVSASVAWFTRPQAPAATPAGTSNATATLLGMIDARRAQLKAEDPNFPGDVYARFEALPVVQANLSPAVKAFL